MEDINTADEAEKAFESDSSHRLRRIRLSCQGQASFVPACSAEDKKARKNLRNVLVQVLTPHYTTDTAALITAAKEIEEYVLAD